jgi:4'-phosphopantetheinyl transferase
MLPPDPNWPVPLTPPPLAADALHVWRADVVRDESTVAERRHVLSPAEQQRADRYRIPAVRRQYILARAALRGILAGYLAADPRELHFIHGPQGKPYLEGAHLQFNLSHSEGIALIAVAREGELGVDVERVRAFPNQRLLAERFFCPREVATLLDLPAEVFPLAFFHAWTRKEAFVKAHGTGIGYGVDRVEVTLLPDEPARILRLDGCEQSAAAWALAHFIPRAEYVAAVAHQSQPRETAMWTWID